MRLAKVPKFYAPYFSPVVYPLPPAFRTHTLSPLCLSTSRLIVFYSHQKARAFWGHKTTAILRFFSSLRIEVPSSRILVHPKISCHHPCIGGSLVMGDEENAIDNKIGRLPGEAKRILQSLASSWGDVVESDALQMIQLKGAMTNEVYQIKWPTNEEHSRKVLARIYGEGVEIFFDRNNEIQTFEFMSKHGQGPRLLGRFHNGRIEEFIHARTLSACDLRDPDTSALIAAKMKEFHDLDMPGPKNVFLWDRMRNWLNVAKSMSSREEAEAFHFDALEEEISILEKNLSTDDHRIGFCHNDLQYGNIMFDEKTRLVTLIDYEYASYNPVAYDIANHFCEMAADYHTETPHILDFSKYPGLEERKRFLRMYLSSSGDQPCDMEIDQLAQDVEKYTLASHLIWGLWGIISEHVNEIDFDYMEYARQRLQQYWLRKPELLGSFRATRVDVVDGKNVQNSAEADRSAGEEILWNLQARQE